MNADEDTNIAPSPVVNNLTNLSKKRKEYRT